MYKHLVTVCNFIDEIKAKYPDTPLERNGDILYCNGNDGTDFDWDANSRLCEFGCGYDKGDVWAFKVMIFTDGLARCYCYPNGEPSPTETIEKNLFSRFEMEEFREYMYRNYDCKQNWDCFLVDIEEI